MNLIVRPWRCAVWIGLCSIASVAAASSTSSGEVFQDCPACPQMKVVPAGAFEMGAAAADKQAAKDEVPRHRVQLTKAFAVGIHEVTRDQFKSFIDATGHNAGSTCHGYEDGHWDGKWEDKPGRTWRAPGYAQDKQHPVVCINWHDAKGYAQWLSAKTGQRYRLLTEAEWEYVAHAGSVQVSHDAANYGAEAECCKSLAEGRDRWITTAPVGSFAPDALGLYDIRGNVWEWLEDCYHDDYAGAPADGSARTSGCSFADNRTVRGASWGDPSHMLRVSYRLRAPLVNRYFTLGFRVARDIQ